MRACFLSPLKVDSNYSISGDSLHHLVHVVRISVGEELLLLDGKGLKVLGKVESISKKEMRLSYLSHETETKSYSLDLALGMPKRDALELCLKEAVELGFRRIFLIKSEYSQMKFPESERVHNILVSALEQSNSGILPEVIQSSWDVVPWNDYKEILLLDSQTKTPLSAASEEGESATSKLLVVGPEGGFSPAELTSLHAKQNLKALRLPTPILRTPTAVAVGAGLLLAKIAGSDKL